MHNVRGSQEGNIKRINLKSGIKIWQNKSRIFNANTWSSGVKVKNKKAKKFSIFLS